MRVKFGTPRSSPNCAAACWLLRAGAATFIRVLSTEFGSNVKFRSKTHRSPVTYDFRSKCKSPRSPCTRSREFFSHVQGLKPGPCSSPKPVRDIMAQRSKLKRHATQGFFKRRVCSVCSVRRHTKAVSTHVCGMCLRPNFSRRRGSPSHGSTHRRRSRRMPPRGESRRGRPTRSWRADRRSWEPCVRTPPRSPGEGT